MKFKLKSCSFAKKKKIEELFHARTIAEWLTPKSKAYRLRPILKL
jgi:hypothetical protein